MSLVCCAVCGSPIFYCAAIGRDYSGAVIEPEDWTPYCSHYEQPKRNDAMLCPECGEQFGISTKGGFVFLLESGAWWPFPPPIEDQKHNT